jgi:hypothetical protein
MPIAFAIVLAVLALMATRLREQHIRTFAFPQGIFAKVIATYPHLSQRDMALVSHGLRQFFLAYLRRCWRLVCLEENINPRKPSRLPLLFALNRKLAIANGFHYAADCGGVLREGDSGSTGTYCGGDFANSAIDGGTAGLSDDGAGHHGGDGHGHGGDGGDAGSGGRGGGDGCSGGCVGGCGGD